LTAERLKVARNAEKFAFEGGFLNET